MATAGGGGSWQQLLLAALRAPFSQLTDDALTWWAESEGTPPSWNNWLATTLNGYGGVSVNSAGVKRYPSVADGVAATAATLYGGAYVNVVRTFREGSSLENIWSAINSSPWCAHCQGGLYPVVLFRNLGATPSTGGGVQTYPGHVPSPSETQARAVDAFDQLRQTAGRSAGLQINSMHAWADRARKARR